MKNGQTVAAFEREFASYVGAKYAIALCNGTATLHTALVALGVKPGDRVAVPPLTMSATTIAVLHAGAVPVFCDVDERTWLMSAEGYAARAFMPVSLYGLSAPLMPSVNWAVPTPEDADRRCLVDDAAQTLRRHSGADFTSYSFQASKVLALGEGGMLVTNDEELATRAREFSSLGYRMRADQPRIDPDALKSPTFDRHYSLGYNYRLNDLTAAEGLRKLTEQTWDADIWYPHEVEMALNHRKFAADFYRRAIEGCDWITPQHVPDGWHHDYWTYAVACDTPQRALDLSAAIVKHGGEKPYPAWKLTYQEPAFLWQVDNKDYPDIEWVGSITNPKTGLPSNWAVNVCPIAESLQPRLLQFQCNRLDSAEQNARALRNAIRDLS